jgi:hypothetical protein
MNQPRIPKDPPPGGASPATNPTGKTPDGIPEGMEDQKPKGHPTSDRAETETAPLNS